jgi:Lrp/AsnC family transcriptional regulator for asnA, asnC and gidA
MNKIDKIDAQIINLLGGDGRMSCAEIARRIGNISERSVRYRIERLQQVGVIQILAVVNPKTLGYSVVADVLLQVESDVILEVAQKMTGYDCVSYVACAIGETDVSVQLFGRSTSEIYQFITTVIGKMPGVIKTTTSIVPVVLKDTYQWRIPNSDCVEVEPEGIDR